MKFYPMKFETIFKEKIWGGDKIRTVLHKDFSPLENCGETWELSAVDGNVSEIANGPLKGTRLFDVLQQFAKEIMGEKVQDQYGSEFPLLVKFIDAQQDLSVQVHPDDELAKKRHNGFGKTEMWYIMQADEGASLIAGFNRPLDKDSYLNYFNEGKLDEILNRVEVSKGDVFYIPAGRIHTIGKGIMLAEIQQTSDLTYRIYDFERVDAQGNKRELHTDEAVDALDFEFKSEYKTSYTDQVDERSTLVESQYFHTNKFNLTENRSLTYSGDSFIIYVCMEGEAELKYGSESQNMVAGDVFLIPAVLTKIDVQTVKGVEFLEVYIPS